MTDRPCEKCSGSDAYCVSCGKPKEKIVSIAGLTLLLACSTMLFFEVYAIFWGMGTILPDIGNYSVPILILAPSPEVLLRITGIAAASWYLLIAAVAVISFIVLIYASRRGFMDMLHLRTDRMDSVPLYGVVTLFAATVSFNLIFNMILIASGTTPAVPEYPDPEWIQWYALLNASVWEEVLCRVLMIGVPIMLLGMMMKEKGAWKRLFGRFRMDGAAVIFIVISASLFSYAHLSGWDVFKIIPTFVSGLALGYLFVKYGIYASVMLHFLVNYMSSVNWIFGSITGSVWLGLFLLTITVLGTVFFVRYLILGLKGLKKIVSEQSSETVL